MTWRAWITTALLLTGCGGSGSMPSSPTTPPPAARITETFDYTLRLTPSSWPLSGPMFTSRNGAIDMTVRVDSPVAIPYTIDLLFIGGEVPHSEGSGGAVATGPGPVLAGHWDVGFSGQFQARIFPAARQPLPVPAPGINIPTTFSITHP